MAEVFISYPHEAAKNAAQLANSLRARGIDTWCAEDNLTPGDDDWKTKVRTALKDAQAVIFVVAPGSHPSPWMQEEQMAALESYWAGNKKMLIPLLINNANPPAFLRQWRSLKVGKKSDLGKAVSQVVRLLRSHAEPQVKVTKKIKEERNERLQKVEESMRQLQADERLWANRRA
jgi:hypothetical protein